MLLEPIIPTKYSTKKAWIKGKANNAAHIPTAIARIEEVLFVVGNLAYRVQYESGHVGYIFLSEIDQCEIFQIESKIKS